MIRDYELLRNARLIFDKELIIWGAGISGREIFQNLQECGVNTVAFIDTDISKRGEFCGKPVYEPEKVREFVDKGNIAIILSPLSEGAREEILTQIRSYGSEQMTIFTRYMIDFVLSVLESEQSKSKEDTGAFSSMMGQLDEQNKIIKNMELRLRFMESLWGAEMAEDVVFIYQSKKVASRTITKSAKNAGIYGFHVHNFIKRGGMAEKDIKNFIKNKHGKVISLVREPVARQISLMWHYLGENYKAYISKYGSFDNIENAFFSIPNMEDEFEWYKEEMETVLGINIYEFPFDRDKGYSIIEKDGISLLLIKTERLSSMEKVIGDFLGKEDFKLINTNITGKKVWGHAYKDYLCNAKIPLEFLEFYYEGNKYVDYFYTEEEKRKFYDYWRKPRNH